MDNQAKPETDLLVLTISRRSLRRGLRGAGVLALLIPGALIAGEVTQGQITTFVPGAAVVAAEFNANLEVLRLAINDNDSRISENLAISCEVASRSGYCSHIAACEDAGLCPRVVFVSSQTYTADLGGLAGGDATCQALADAAGLAGTYLAWLSDASNSPATRFTQSARPYVRTDGVRVADNWAALINTASVDLPAPISVDENGADTLFSAVWTGTGPDGQSVGGRCNNWTLTSGTNGTSGVALTTGSQWTEALGSRACNLESGLYCFQQ